MLPAPGIRAVGRRFDEHYNIIRFVLALNEVGGARELGIDKRSNKKKKKEERSL